MRSLVLPVLTCLLLLTGCGLDETYTGLGEGALPGDPLNPKEQPVECPECPGCNCGSGPAADVAPEAYGAMTVEDMSGFGFRFDSLVMTEPFTGTLGKGVNDYFAKEIEAKNLNVLMVIGLDDRETSALEMLIGPGKVKDPGYAFSADSGKLVCELYGQLFTTLEASQLDFPNDLFEPPSLPIKHLKLTGIFEADGSAIGEGKLDGVLLEEDAKDIKVMGQALSDFLETGMKIPKNVDVDDDGSPDGWKFLFDYTALQIEYTDD